MADLDRVVTLRKRGPGHTEDGTPVRGEIEDVATVWARLDTVVESELVTGSGRFDVRYQDRRVYRIRYRADFVAGERFIRPDGYSVDFEVETTTEVGRRKYLDLGVLLSS